MRGSHRRSGALVFVAAVLAAALPCGAATFTVNTTSDASDWNPGDGICEVNPPGSGNCSLRAAIEQANAGPGSNLIQFALPPGSTITVLSALPTLATPTNTISGDPTVTIQAASSAVSGLTIGAGGNVVTNLWLRGFGGNGAVYVTGPATLNALVIGGGGTGILITAPTVVTNCRIGTLPDGATPDPNSIGIHVTGGNNTLIGGAGRNIVSGNVSAGIQLEGPSSSTTIQNNFIGTDVTGNVALQNGSGINVYDSPTNVIGVDGSGAGSGNVISGAGGCLNVSGANSGGNRISGNNIGLGADGSTALGAARGVMVQSGAAGNVIGGNLPSQRNVIGGINPGTGFGDAILFQSAGGGNQVLGNYIGTDGTGNSPRPCDGNAVRILDTTTVFVGSTTAGNVLAACAYGVLLQNNSPSTFIRGNKIGVGADGVTPMGNGYGGIYVGNVPFVTLIGGVNPGEGNVIANSLTNHPGVTVANATSGPITIRGNSIYGNGGLGIDLNGDNATPNDPCDADAGPNGLQNFPVIVAAIASGGATTVQGTLNSASGSAYTIDVYASPAGAQGKTWIGSTTADLSASCDGTWTLGPVPVDTTGQVITATATDSFGATSEFGAAFAATPVELERFAAE